MQFDKVKDKLCKTYQILKNYLVNVYENNNEICSDNLEYMLSKSIIAGGSISSLFLNEEPSDYDIFFFDKTTIDILVRLLETYCRKDIIKNNTSAMLLVIKGTKIHIIKTLYADNINGILNSFDFLHCMAYYGYNSKELFLPEKYYEILVGKNLVVNYKMTFRLSLIERLNKLLKKGWNIDTKECLKISFLIMKESLKCSKYRNMPASASELFFMDLNYSCSSNFIKDLGKQQADSEDNGEHYNMNEGLLKLLEKSGYDMFYDIDNYFSSNKEDKPINLEDKEDLPF